MPAATRSYPSDINPSITQASLINGLRDALVAAGLPTPLKQFTSGTNQLVVWELVFDATRFYGKAYFSIKVSNTLTVSQSISSGWTDATNTLVNASSDVHLTTFSSSIPIKFQGFATPEFVLLSATQGGSIQMMLGYLRLQTADAFDDISFPKIFIPITADLTSLTCTGLTPYSSSVFYTSLNNSNMANADSYFQQRSMATGFFLYGSSNTGIIARSSDDLGMGANTGTTRYDTYTPSGLSEQWIVTRSGAGTLLIRIA